VKEYASVLQGTHTGTTVNGVVLDERHDAAPRRTLEQTPYRRR
jgi:hypothetical protein